MGSFFSLTGNLKSSLARPTPYDVPNYYKECQYCVPRQTVGAAIDSTAVMRATIDSVENGEVKCLVELQEPHDVISDFILPAPIFNAAGLQAQEGQDILLTLRLRRPTALELESFVFVYALISDERRRGTILNDFSGLVSRMMREMAQTPVGFPYAWLLSPNVNEAPSHRLYASSFALYPFAGEVDESYLGSMPLRHFFGLDRFDFPSVEKHSMVMELTSLGVPVLPPTR